MTKETVDFNTTDDQLSRVLNRMAELPVTSIIEANPHPGFDDWQYECAVRRAMEKMGLVEGCSQGVASNPSHPPCPFLGQHRDCPNHAALTVDNKRT
jgi:hypothetical protein